MDPKPQSRPATAESGSPLRAPVSQGTVATVLWPDAEGYPRRLRELASGAGSACTASSLADKPLWLRGCAAALAVQPAVTIVGSRAATQQGVALAHALAAALAAQGALVISGGALGIDAAAHRGALAADGRTCAVLGCGVDIAYPQRHTSLLAEITRHGCLLSSFPLGTPPRRWHFPVRNELMAALAELVVLIEARADSGSLITAQHARRHGRVVAAFSGSAGAEAAIAAGAHRVDSIAEVVALLTRAAGPRRASTLVCAGTQAHSRPAAPAPSYLDESQTGAQAEKVLLALSAPAAAIGSAVDVSELCAKTGLSPGDCAAALVDLELRGRCTRLAGGRYIGHAPLS